MSIPEGYLPREGDVVLVRAEVQYDVKPKEDADSDGLKVFVRPLESYTDVRVPVRSLVGVHSRRFDEGERVRFVNEPLTTATVLAMCDEFVWVKTEIGGSYITSHTIELEQAPKPVVDEKATFVEPEAESAAPSLRPESEDDIKF